MAISGRQFPPADRLEVAALMLGEIPSHLLNVARMATQTTGTGPLPLARVQNHLGELKVPMLPGVISAFSNGMEFFPGISKSWSLPFMINDEQAPTGRPAGALGWAGVANLYYWIDRANGYGGFWATQTLPWGDATAFGSYLDFETALYASLESRPHLQDS